jgi:hypothetical protein
MADTVTVPYQGTLPLEQPAEAAERVEPLPAAVYLHHPNLRFLRHPRG